MYIELPTLSTGLEIGSINITTDDISIKNSNLINFNCTSRVYCCSNLKIPVTDFDINRIQDKGYELDQIIESLSPVLLRSKTYDGKTEKVYTLKRKPFEGSCTFLENNLCKIHEFKPFACQIYPFSLDIVNSDLIRIVIHTEELCKSIISSNYAESNNIEILNSILTNVKLELNARNIPNN
ncbi:MAG: YkgJ family cysteine cluster protein [Candidatus Kariarchaeaceae archaeon]|jgi:Fe-S-cluster containining protein